MQQDQQLESACRNAVAKAMQELGLQSRVSSKFKPTTTKQDPSKQPTDNKLDGNFTADAPNRKWVTDINQITEAAIRSKILNLVVTLGMPATLWT